MSIVLTLATEIIKTIAPEDLQNNKLDLALDLFPKIKELQENLKRDRLYKLLNNVFKDGTSIHALKDTSSESKDRALIFEDLIQVCMNDSDSEKTPHYSQLAIAILSGFIEKKLLKRHLLLSLKQLSLSELEILRTSYIATNFSIISNTSYSPLSVTENLRNAQKEILGDVHIRNLQQLGLITDERLTETGTLFVKSIYKRDELEASSVSWEIWQKGPLALATVTQNSPNQDKIIKSFKKLRIRCVEIDVNEISFDTSITKQYKAILFPNDYKNLIYSEKYRLIKFSEDNSYKCIAMPKSLLPEGFNSRDIRFHEGSDIDTQCKQIAKSFDYLLPDFPD